jgi:type 1 glutamine amidotransferase
MFHRSIFAALAMLLGIAIFAMPAAFAAGKQTKKIRVVIIDGHNNHEWRQTTPFMKKVLEANGRFTVDISTHPQPNKPLPDGWKSGTYPPDLTQYDVVLSNYNGPAWPKELQAVLNERLKGGQIGLVIVHAANNSFGGWDDYRLMIGMGWYGKNTGQRLKLDDNGKEIRMEKGEDMDPGHRYTGPFQVAIRDKDHPVTKGMPLEWMHNNDELYDNMRGPIQNIHLLATAYSKGTKTNEPMIWTIDYGKGRVFHTPMGHDVNAMKCVGFITTLLRGTEWAATGAVTIPLPDNFPQATKTSVAKD